MNNALYGNIYKHGDDAKHRGCVGQI